MNMTGKIKIVRRSYKTGDACRLCGLDLGPVLDSVPAAPVYAIQDNMPDNALCPACAQAIAARTGQKLQNDAWIHDLMRTLYDREIGHGPIDGGQLERMGEYLDILPSRAYMALYLRWNGAWPEQLPAKYPFRPTDNPSSRLAIQHRIEINLENELKTAMAQLREPSRKAYILYGTSDMDQTFSQPAIKFLERFHVHTLADMDLFSLDETIARIAWSRTYHEGWRAIQVNPAAGISAVIHEIYEYMSSQHEDQIPCGTLMCETGFQCPDCILRAGCRNRACMLEAAGEDKSDEGMSISSVIDI